MKNPKCDRYPDPLDLLQTRQAIFDPYIKRETADRVYDEIILEELLDVEDRG
jgi:hypothetical protein